MNVSQRAATAVEMPKQVRLAVGLMYVGAGLSVFGQLLDRPATRNRIIPIGDPRTTAYHAGVIIGWLVFAVGVAGLWLWMSWAVRRGKNWARAVSAGFLALGALRAVAGLVQGGISAVFLTLAALVGLACVILLYQRESSTFFADGRALAGYYPPPGPAAAASDGAPPPYFVDQVPGGTAFAGQPAWPSAPLAARRKKPHVIIVSAAIVVLIGAAAAVVAEGLAARTANHASKTLSTADVRVIVPAPATAGGLRQDYVAEKTRGFRSYVAAARHQYLALRHGTVTSFTVALYAYGSPTTPQVGLDVLYVGMNTRGNLAKRGTAVDLVGGAVAHMSNVRATSLPGGPGDTSYECASAMTQGQPAVVCGWSTDRSLGLLIEVSPDATVRELATVMKEMRPDLVRS